VEWKDGRLYGAGLGLLLAVWTHSISAQDQPRCFDLTAVEFPTWANHPADSLYYQVPPRIRLMPMLDGESALLDVPDGALPPPHGWSRWWVDRDSIRMRWSTGYFGVEVKLLDSEGTVSGTANPFTDVAGVAIPSDEITAMPVDCSAPVVYRESEMRRFPRSVPLEGGLRLRLGDPVPDGLQVDTLRRAEVVAAQGAEWAARATSIGVTRTRLGRVMRLRLTFPVEVDGTVLRDLLAVEAGPWTSEGGSGGTYGWMWDGRGERVHLIESGSRLILILEDPRIDFRR
jgi:hypothetical protein